jgi:hypothetical protein
MEKSRIFIDCNCCTTHSYAEEWKWQQRIKNLGNGSELMYCYNLETDKPGNFTCVDITCPVCGATEGIRITSIDDSDVEECKVESKQLSLGIPSPEEIRKYTMMAMMKGISQKMGYSELKDLFKVEPL